VRTADIVGPPYAGGSAAFISLERDWRWRVLDTFDWYSPRYQSWHTHHEVFWWFKENGFERIEVLAPSVSQIGVKAGSLR